MLKILEEETTFWRNNGNTWHWLLRRLKFLYFNLRNEYSDIGKNCHSLEIQVMGIMSMPQCVRCVMLEGEIPYIFSRPVWSYRVARSYKTRVERRRKVAPKQKYFPGRWRERDCCCLFLFLFKMIYRNKLKWNEENWVL